MISLRVYGTPVPKGSRIAGIRKDGKVYTRPERPDEHDWVETVAQTANWKARTEPPADPPYLVDLDFYLQRGKRPKYPYPTASGDLDKLARAVIDGLVNGGVLTDDRHVTEIKATKTFAPTLDEVGVHVVVSSIRELGLAA